MEAPSHEEQIERHMEGDLGMETAGLMRWYELRVVPCFPVSSSTIGGDAV